jgi:acylphosphatase
VRNRPDGTVEAVFEGPADAVESLVAWCRRGPRGASVSGVDVDWDEPARAEAHFEVR